VKPVETKEVDSLDPLSSEMQGWGFAPKANLEEKYHKVFPPVIEETPVEPSFVENLFQDGDYLETTLVDHDRTDPTFHVPAELAQELIDQVDDEISAESFWRVDDIKPLKADEAADIGKTNLHDVTADLTEKVEEFRAHEAHVEIVEAPIEHSHAEQASHASMANIDQEELIAKLKLSLRPMIEEIVKEYCRQSAEKVAWEVIPDLAENLIRKEIKSISDSL